ncbi:hypothetical protein Btru_042042 [Bulinus truncatus]|nr:hypothetical protein Btru_042042 [Bulinus truncatus]
MLVCELRKASRKCPPGCCSTTRTLGSWSTTRTCPWPTWRTTRWSRLTPRWPSWPYSSSLSCCSPTWWCSDLLILSPSLYPGGRYMLLSLSISNILVGFFSMPSFAFRYLPRIRTKLFTSRFACLFLLTSLGLPGSGTLYTYLLIALDRFIAVQWPTSYSSFLNDVKSIKIISLMWTYIVCMCLMIISIWGAYEPSMDPRLVPCKYNTTITSDILTKVSSSIFIALVFCAIFVNVFLTFRTTLEARSYTEDKTNMTRHKNRQIDYLLASTRVTNILLIIFFLLWSPSALMTPLARSRALSQQHLEIYKVTAQFLRLTNALFHAPAHAMVRKQLRHLFFLMLTTAPWHWNDEMASFHREISTSVEGHVRFSIEVTTFDITPGSCSPKYSASSVG